MNSKKLIFIVALLAVIGASWIAAISALNSTEAVDTQRELTAKADALAEKKLYVRAIPLYNEALTYNTDETELVEAKLLDAYYGFGYYDEYCELTEKRASSLTAAEDEYITAAELYLASNDLEEAVALLKKGIAALQSEKLSELYEANRYAYKLRLTDFSEIVTTQTNEVFPGRNGGKWQFVGKDGRAVIKAGYDEVTVPNAKGFAVVKNDGLFTMLDKNGNLFGIDEVGLEAVKGVNSKYILGKKDGLWGFYSQDFILASESLRFEDITVHYNGYAAVKRDGKWAFISDQYELGEFLYDDIKTNSYGAVVCGGASAVRQSDKWYLVKPDGTRLVETGYADIKAPEGGKYIAVADGSGRWGFIDYSGEPVLDCRYDDAYSFSEQLAAVRSGSGWLYISERGNAAIDGHFLEAYPFHGGRALIRIQNGTAVITRLLEEK